ncbi:Ig-like domain-containing protein [Aquisphaera giovannonii]|uniref:Ig-like domain-containing protein n=1 Tax=Aquisphaera giovannonii TaxID=406548 RepID=UPI0011DFE643|nr:Ig-like domain-containing protein [Aquisphaera giovannonii]
MREWRLQVLESRELLSTVMAVDDAYNTDAKTPLIVTSPGVLANDSRSDGGQLSASLVTGPGHGSVALNADGSFQYTPRGGYTGLDRFAYVAVGGGSGSNLATVVISVNAKTQLVTNTGDSGVGSLRQALIIAAASNTTAPDVIQFAIPGTGPFVIQPLTPLPEITHPTVIDGYTQSGSRANGLATGEDAAIFVQLDGSRLSPGSSGLVISAGGSTVTGLSITAFATPIDVHGGGANVIQGNFLGLSPAGSLTPNAGPMVVAGAGNNLIGGSKAAQRNVIAGSGSYEVTIGGPNNIFQGNYVGTNLSGTARLTAGGGVLVSSASNTVIGGLKPASGNVLTGLTIGTSATSPTTTGTRVQGNSIGADAAGVNGFGGTTSLIVAAGAGTVIGGTRDTAGNVIRDMVIGAGGSGTLIQGNAIGVDASGLRSLGSPGSGIVLDYSDHVTIGGTAAGAGNVISGNTRGYGIVGYYTFDASSILIQGNLIGTDATGMTASPNGWGGVRLSGGGNTIGGTGRNAGNVISGNGGAGLILDYGSSTALIQGNFIGSDASGLRPVGNAGDGIVIQGLDSNGNTIGGTAKGAGNVIAYNGGAGVGIPSGSDATGNAILSNAIFANVGLGIDLGDDGVTANTPGGPHDGPNLLQNAPVLLVAASRSNQVAIKGTLSSAPNATFTIQFFANGSADPSGNGEGQSYLGATTVTTDANGDASFQASFRAQPGSVISATATDQGGNTSEFAANQSIVVMTGKLLAQDDAYRTDANSPLLVGAPGVRANDLAFDGGAFSTNLVRGPGHGTLTITADGGFLYVPAPGYVGTDSFTYQDRLGNATALATVTITVASKTLVVTNTNDSGPGSLRQAILDADLATTDAPDTILFDLQGDGPFLIMPTSPLPAITHATIIDGYSQPGAMAATPGPGGSAVILVQLNGLAQPGGDGLLATAPGVVIRGLSFAGFATAIRLTGAGGDVVEGNFIGTDVTGTTADFGNNLGIYIESPNNTIGGTAAGAGNLVSGNWDVGILLDGPSASNNVIQGNRVGTDATGMTAVWNWSDGIALRSGASSNRIGGTEPGAGNILSGNAYGLSFAAGCAFNTVQGNLIGADATGQSAIGNMSGGIDDDGGDNLIGGTASGAGNVISGNWGSGLIVEFASRDVIQGNAIGTDVTGSLPIGNWGDGVTIRNFSSRNTIGGGDAGSGNTIAFNGGNGVTIGSFAGDLCYRNAVLSNVITGNLGLGIDLGSDGPGPIVPGGPYDGPNHFQNAPVIEAVVTDGVLIALTGTFSGPPATMLTLQFFVNDEADPTGFGQGQYYVGSATITTDADGNATFTVILPAAVSPGRNLSATATDANGNTSEFAADVAVNAAIQALAATGMQVADIIPAELALDLALDAQKRDGTAA